MVAREVLLEQSKVAGLGESSGHVSMQSVTLKKKHRRCRMLGLGKSLEQQILEKSATAGKEHRCCGKAKSLTLSPIEVAVLALPKKFKGRIKGGSFIFRLVT